MIDFPFYVGQGSQREKLAQIHEQLGCAANGLDPKSYRADPGLAAAANVALLLGQPLLLTGEPGVGKTEFANSLAWELGLLPVLKFETKSTSAARDLFYTYDALARLQEARVGAASAVSFVNFNALGLAILRTRAPEQVAYLLNGRTPHEKATRSVVLIDEVDKAPRDFSNDLLNELEYMYFRIPEASVDRVETDIQYRPIVIITSNSEKDLPNAFLRRCIYYNIPFPDRERLVEIVFKRLGDRLPDRKQIESAVDLLSWLRDHAGGLRKKPATAELISWLSAMIQVSGGRLPPPAEWSGPVLQTLSSLIKTADDQAKGRELVQQWLNQRR